MCVLTQEEAVTHTLTHTHTHTHLASHVCAATQEEAVTHTGDESEQGHGDDVNATRK